ncbi:MAG: hypothetical protein IT542_07615 [Rubellimicrobium sp.]|nr:hypothetical protein [Rubellimicrobium sp.]
MQRFEYRIIPAPRRGPRGRGLRSAEDRFAAALEAVMNAQGAEGWDYIRSDTLPLEERQGLTGRTTSWQVLLVFRRALPQAPDSGAGAAPVLLTG